MNDEAALSPRPSRVRRAIVGLLGLLLLAAAIAAVASSGDALRSSFAAARRAPWWLVASLLVLPAVNWLCVSASFTLLTRRYGAVTHAEMAALVGSAWLLNYLPMRPGMVGRLAYHKAVNRIRVKDSARVLLAAVAFTAAAVLVLLAIGLAVLPSAGGWWPLLCPLLAAAGAPLRRWGRLAAVFSLRYADMLAWVARYAAAFAIVGEPLSALEATLVSCVSQVALAVPLLGNGLGLREWSVGLVTSTVGLAADLANRAAEVLVAVPVGLASLGLVGRRMAAARASVGASVRASGPTAVAAGPDPADDPLRRK